ncbi:MAG TPA: methyltransferase type 11 [Bacteroidales bacterium]|nr:methyltransferase type 11 [Bacteroidales bacterium]
MNFLEYKKMYQLEESNWWYTGRRNLIIKAVGKFQDESGDNVLQILDAGCGTGINLRYLNAYGKACGLDISKDALKFSSNRGLSTLICGSLDKLPLKSKQFDLVVALDVIEHVQDDLAAVLELNRVLRPGGCLIATVPAFQFLWSNHDIAVHHKRRYTRSELCNILRLGGFGIKRATYWNFFFFLPIATMRIFKRCTTCEEENKTDLIDLPSPINQIMLCLLQIENSILEWLNLPFGVSVMCVCRKVCDGQR